MSSSLFNELNEAQKKAVAHVKGASLILAGAGSGKTRVLTAKVLHLIEDIGCQADSIMMVTFTNKAAKEMRERVGRPLGFVGTYHSFCARLLRIYADRAGLERNFVIYDRSEQEAVVKDLSKKMKLTRSFTPSFLLNRISSSKDRLITPEQYSALFTDEMGTVIGKMYSKYSEMLIKNNALDFDDLLLKTAFLLRDDEELRKKLQNTYLHFLIDEFHDTNFAQYTVTKYLALAHKNITAVGDFSQSIYSWRGAEIENLKKFEQDFAPVTVYHLNQNYRSTSNILDFAYRVITNNQSHPVLQLFTDNGEGEEVSVLEFENEQGEALYVASEIQKLAVSVPLKRIAVLYRVNAQSRTIEEVFLRFGLPYVLIGGTGFYERMEVKDILCYIKLIVNRHDTVARKRAEKLGKRKLLLIENWVAELEKNVTPLPDTLDIIDTVLELTGYLHQFSETNEEDVARVENIKELRSVAVDFPSAVDFVQQIALVESEYSKGEKRSSDAVQMMTLHQAKGLEFSHVFMIGLEEGLLPHARSQFDRHAMEEERRLFYVGVTRAMEKLHITHARRRFFFGVRSPGRVSRFLAESGNYEHSDY